MGVDRLCRSREGESKSMYRPGYPPYSSFSAAEMFSAGAGEHHQRTARKQCSSFIHVQPSEDHIKSKLKKSLPSFPEWEAGMSLGAFSSKRRNCEIPRFFNGSRQIKNPRTRKRERGTGKPIQNAGRKTILRPRIITCRSSTCRSGLPHREEPSLPEVPGKRRRPWNRRKAYPAP